MKLTRPFAELIWITPNPLETIERAGRTCYKSEDRITEGSAVDFVQMLLKRGHEAMIEHASMSMRIICDRGVTHEIVRHRLFSYAQESTRYCNYKGGVTFIIPPWVSISPGEHSAETLAFTERDAATSRWASHMLQCESAYLSLLAKNWQPQQARSVLPNSLKTEIVVTGNLRQWRHFFRLRCDKAAHPQMREVAQMVMEIAQARIPVIFEDFDLP